MKISSKWSTISIKPVQSMIHTEMNSILMIDSNNFSRLVLRELLIELNIESDSVTSHEQAFSLIYKNLLQRSSYNLILIDTSR